MEHRNYQDDLRPLADLTSAARERLDRLDEMGSRQLTRRSVSERALYFGRSDFEPVISSPLTQPSWDQDTVPTPVASPTVPGYFDDRPLLDRGFDDETVVLHPPGLERVSPEVWARWYIDRRDGRTGATIAQERPASPLQLLAADSEPDFTNTSFPFDSPLAPIGTNTRSSSKATTGLDLPPLNLSTTGPTRLDTPIPSTFNTSYPWRNTTSSPVSFERGRSPGYSIERPGTPGRDTSTTTDDTEDYSWLLRYLPPRDSDAR